ncbi:hypothetical protein ACPCSC_26025 [Streptomyces lavendulocolor]|uniref:hypothetical protein n=1 Tax=Streptomyces lavendulocolor TaxID=67316 RepID=UPI003C2B6029
MVTCNSKRYAVSSPCRLIDSVERQTVPLPEELTETLSRLAEQLYRFTGQAPLAVLKAVITLEGLTREVARQATGAVVADDLSPETTDRALGIGPDKASSRMTGYLTTADSGGAAFRRLGHQQLIHDPAVS